MHHTWLSIMPCSCVVCLPCCVLLLDSSRFVCDREDSFVYAWFVFVASSSSWTRSSSLRDFRQDDHHLGYHYYHCYASCFVLSLCCVTYHCCSSLPNCRETLTFVTRPSKPLFGYLTTFLSPSYSIA